MTSIIITRPHPLDRIWEQAVEAVSDAHHAVENQPRGFTNEENDALNEVLIDAISVVMALPARHVADSLYKLDLTGLADTGHLICFDQRAVFQEGLAVMEAAIARGAKLKKELPDVLEGVAL